MDEEDHGPSPTFPHNRAPQRHTLTTRLHTLRKTFLTRDGLVGSYDYAFLFRPHLPFMRKPNRPPPFFGLHDRMPVLLALLLGFQHALAMLAGIISPPLIMAGAGGVNLGADQTQYLVSTALIVSGLLSAVQITRFRVFRTGYYVGTGLISVVGISFAIIPVASGAFKQMYANGFCPSAEDGSPLPCPDGYGAVLGTAAVCSLLEILISFMPPRIILRMFPPIVTGPTVMLIGINLISSGFKDWAGGSGPCADASPAELFAKCPNVGAPHALPWGSAEYLGQSSYSPSRWSLVWLGTDISQASASPSSSPSFSASASARP